MLLPSRIALAVFAAVALAGAAEAQEAPKLDVPRPSPNATVKQTVGLTDVTVTYSSPAVRGRKIWGNVVPYDEVWRAGANECTKVTFSTPATIGGKTVPAGTYALFLLPTKAGWTFILNKDTSLWGSEGYKAAADVLRVPATVTTIPPRERLAFGVLDFTDASGTLAMEWETVRVGVKFELATRAAVLDQVRALPARCEGRLHLRDGACRQVHQAEGSLGKRLDQGRAPRRRRQDKGGPGDGAASTGIGQEREELQLGRDGQDHLRLEEVAPQRGRARTSW